MEFIMIDLNEKRTPEEPFSSYFRKSSNFFTYGQRDTKIKRVN